LDFLLIFLPFFGINPRATETAIAVNFKNGETAGSGAKRFLIFYSLLIKIFKNCANVIYRSR